MTARTDTDRAVDRAYDRYRRARIKNGTWLHRMPAEHIREHITHLTTAGMPLNAIARAAQISPRTLWPITHGTYPYVQGPTGAAILAVQPPQQPLLPFGMVAITGTTRRLQALVALGYSISDLSRRLGYKNMQQVWEWTRGLPPALTETSAAKVTALYEQLSGTPGTSTRARNDARRNGWPPPLAWDDADLDDPAASPDVGAEVDDLADDVAIRLVLAGERKFRSLRRVDKAALFGDYTAGWTVTRVGRVLNLSTSHVAAWRSKITAATREMGEAA